MFAEQEQKLLSNALTRALKDYKTHSNVYGVSAFDEQFDAQLQKLVLFYSFDFEAIALHLYFKFPQYAFRMKPQAVQYRWYQLSLEREKERIRRELDAVGNREGKREEGEGRQQVEMMKEEKEQQYIQQQQVAMFNLQEKREQYQAALRMAACLDEQQEEAFMIYRPKFIVDSEFKLERQPSEDTMVLSAIMDNQFPFEFGSFDAPQAAPLNLPPPLVLGMPAAAAAPQVGQEEQEYLDDDWQAYESD